MPSLDFSFTTSHGPQKSTSNIDNQIIAEPNNLQGNETPVKEVTVTESINNISDVATNNDEPIPSLAELDDAHVLTKEVSTTEKPVYSNVEVEATRVKSPVETDTFAAYQQFLNTWLHLASINLNRPDLRNLISPIIVTSPKVITDTEVTTQSSSMSPVPTSTSKVTTESLAALQITTETPEVKPISTEKAILVTTPISHDKLTTEGVLLKSDVATETSLPINPSSENVTPTLLLSSSTTASPVTENKTDVIIDENEGQITDVILGFGQNMTQNETEPVQHDSLDNNVDASNNLQQNETAIPDSISEKSVVTAELKDTPLVENSENSNSSPKTGKSLLGNDVSKTTDPNDTLPVAQNEINSNTESLRKNIPAAFSAIPIQYPGGFRYTISHSPVRGSFFFTSPFQG